MNIRRTAKAWGGDDVESRIIFTDVAEKAQHVLRGRIVDLFLDTSDVSDFWELCESLHTDVGSSFI